MSECSPKFYGKPLAIDYSQTGVAVAYLELDPLSQHYRVRFRYAGKQYKRSLRTTDSREARGLKGRVEETILLLERGRLELGEGLWARQCVPYSSFGPARGESRR